MRACSDQNLSSSSSYSSFVCMSRAAYIYIYIPQFKFQEYSKHIFLILSHLETWSVLWQGKKKTSVIESLVHDFINQCHFHLWGQYIPILHFLLLWIFNSKIGTAMSLWLTFMLIWIYNGESSFSFLRHCCLWCHKGPQWARDQARYWSCSCQGYRSLFRG